MPAFSEIVARQPRKPPRVVELKPNAFADTYEDKPTEPVRIGLRLCAELDGMQARSVAAQTATRNHPELGPADDVWVEAYNQALMHYVVAAGTCHPDNVAEPYWDMAYDVVPRALSELGTIRLFDELELLKVTESPLSPEATNEDLDEIIELLRSGAMWNGQADGDARWLRRVLRRVLEQARPVDIAATISE